MEPLLCSDLPQIPDTKVLCSDDYFALMRFTLKLYFETTGHSFTTVREVGGLLVYDSCPPLYICPALPLMGTYVMDVSPRLRPGTIAALRSADVFTYVTDICEFAAQM